MANLNVIRCGVLWSSLGREEGFYIVGGGVVESRRNFNFNETFRNLLFLIYLHPELYLLMEYSTELHKFYVI